MKMITAVALAALAVTAPAHARNNAVTVTLQSVLDMPEAQGKLDGSVKFYMAGTKSPKIVKSFGTDTSNAQTNAFNKSPEEACRWNVLSALIKLQERAKRDGANAVVDLVSYRDHEDFKSTTDLQCSDGAFLGRVALRGNIASVK